jgi:hypothetical protein
MAALTSRPSDQNGNDNSLRVTFQYSDVNNNFTFRTVTSLASTDIYTVIRIREIRVPIVTNEHDSVVAYVTHGGTTEAKTEHRDDRISRTVVLKLSSSASGAHPTSYPMGTRGSFPGVKRPGREADHSPPSSAEFKNA